MVASRANLIPGLRRMAHELRMVFIRIYIISSILLLGPQSLKYPLSSPLSTNLLTWE